MKPGAREFDKASLHAACAVIRGEKWSAPIWVHTKPYHPETMDAAVRRKGKHDPEADQHEHSEAGNVYF